MVKMPSCICLHHQSYSDFPVMRLRSFCNLNASCSLERCDFRVEVGLKEKWDAGIDQSIEGVRMKTAMNPLTIR